jgi:7,8-dihydro-6-hydroxymethylpterin-pyrophosphokinase
MHERAFVLQPLLDLFGEDFHWGVQPALRELLARPEVAAQAAEPLL